MKYSSMFAAIVVCLALCTAQAVSVGGSLGGTTTTGGDNGWKKFRLELPAGPEKTAKLTVTATFARTITTVGSFVGQIQVGRGSTVDTSFASTYDDSTKTATLIVDDCKYPGGGNWTVKIRAGKTESTDSQPVGGVSFSAEATFERSVCSTVLIILLVAGAVVILCVCAVGAYCCRSKSSSSSGGNNGAPAHSVSVPMTTQNNKPQGGGY